jgi:hypothetical protein
VIVDVYRDDLIDKETLAAEVVEPEHGADERRQDEQQLNEREGCRSQSPSICGECPILGCGDRNYNVETTIAGMTLYRANDA